MPFASIAFRKNKRRDNDAKTIQNNPAGYARSYGLPTCADGAGHHACSFRHKMLYGLVPRKILIIQQKAGPEE